MPMESTAAASQPVEEELDERDEDELDEDEEGEDDEDSQENDEVEKEAPKTKKEKGKEAGAEAKAAPSPEKKESTLLEKADGLITRLEEIIGKLKGTKLAEGKKILAEAREHKKDLKIKLAKIRKGGEADISAVMAQAEGVEKRAEKLTAAFEVGEMVEWTNDKGVKMRGEVIGLGEVEGVVIVKTEKNPKGFAVSKSKLEKTAVSPDRAAALIGAATDFDSLIAAVEQVGALRGEDGKIYSKESLVELVQTVRDKPEIKVDSALLISVPIAGGLRSKLIELMRPRAFDGLREDYTKKNAVLTKNYSGIIGWTRRLWGSSGYKKAMEERNAAYEKYAEGRAEMVLENVDKMITEEIALADSQADAFQAEKGWGSKLYDRYKKLGKVRMFISGGLVIGGSLLAGGAPAFVMAGMIGARRLLGGTGAAVGSYDIMNKLAEKNKPKFDLTPEQQAELAKFENEKGLQWYKKEIKLFGQPSAEGQAWQRNKQELEAKRAAFQKLQVEQKAPQMSDADLHKAIRYYEAVTVWHGKKPSEDSTYMILMAEKAKRYKKALQAEASPEAKPADKRPFEEQVAERRKEKTAEAMVTVIDSLKQRYLVDQKLFEQMRAMKGTPEQRKKSPEYAAWVAGKKKLAEMDAKLPPDIQVFLQNYGEGRKHPSLDMLVPKQANDMKRLKLDQIQEEDVWGGEWQLRAELQAELNELLDKNALLNKEAEDEVREAMTQTVKTVEADREKVDKTKAAVLSFLDDEMRKQDADVEKRRRLAVYADAAMKAAAAAIGLLIGSGVIQEWLKGKLWGDTSVVEHKKGAMGEWAKHGPRIEPHKVGPDLEHYKPVAPEPEVPPEVPEPEVPKPEVHDVVPTWKPNIKELQMLLDKAGHSPGGIDGIQGKLTTGAIKAFQLENGLPVTGKASKALMAALRQAAEENAQAAAEAAQVAKEAAKEAAADTLTTEHSDFAGPSAEGGPTTLGEINAQINAAGEGYDLDGTKLNESFEPSAVDEPSSGLATEGAGADAPVEAPEPTAAGAAEQAAVAAKELGEMSLDVSGGHEMAGRVWVEGNKFMFKFSMENVGHDDLIAARILRPNWQSIVEKMPGAPTDEILREGKKLLFLQEAMKQAAAQGNEDLTKAITRSMRITARNLERSTGDVFRL